MPEIVGIQVVDLLVDPRNARLPEEQPSQPATVLALATVAERFRMKLSALGSRIDQKVQKLRDKVSDLCIDVEEQKVKHKANQKKEYAWQQGLSPKQCQERDCVRLRRGVKIHRFIFHLLCGAIVGFFLRRLLLLV